MPSHRFKICFRFVRLILNNTNSDFFFFFGGGGVVIYVRFSDFHYFGTHDNQDSSKVVDVCKNDYLFRVAFYMFSFL